MTSEAPVLRRSLCRAVPRNRGRSRRRTPSPRTTRWPQHHWIYGDLLADPPPGLRIIAPDLPGYGWSGPAPHIWDKEDVASDVLALLDALGLDRVLLVGRDWGGYVGYRMVLGEPRRFDGELALNMAHPWVTQGARLRRPGARPSLRAHSSRHLPDLPAS